MQRMKYLIEVSGTYSEVGHPLRDGNPKLLGPMVCGYVECALWSTTFADFTDGCMAMDSRFSIHDIEGPTLAQMIRDCLYFYQKCKDDLESLYWDISYDESSWGHDFWLSRNGHGAGFFDHHPKDERWDRLQREASSGHGPFDLYVTDKGTIAAEHIPFDFEWSWEVLLDAAKKG